MLKNLNNAGNKEQKWLQVCKWYRWLCKCRKNGGKEAGFRCGNKIKNSSRSAVWGGRARSNRGLEDNSRAQIAGWEETDAV